MSAYNRIFFPPAPILLCIVCFFTQAAGIRAQSFTSSNLPIVVLNKTEPWQQIDSAWDGFEIVVQMGIIDNGPGKRNHLSDAPTNYNGLVKLKVQGSSSVAFPKRSFRITTLSPARRDTHVSLLNMPPHEDWVLKALYQDKSLLRDDLAFRIFNQMGHYSSRCRFFELVVDGDYRGVYQLLEKVKRSPGRVNIAKMEPHHVSGREITGGYIISLDKYKPGIDKGWHSKYMSNATNDSANFFLYCYPKPDSMPPAQMAYIKGYFDNFEDALASNDYTNTVTGYRKYIDVQSFIDNFIINELSRNVDGYRASTFFYKNRESAADNKLHAGPIWDFNIAFGNATYNGGNDPYWWAYDQYALTNYNPWWWRRFMTDPGFRNELRCRYQQLRMDVLSEQRLFSYIDEMAAYLNEAQQRNFQRFPILGTIIYPNPSPAPATWQGELGYLKWWLQERLTWMDKMLAGDCTITHRAINEDPDLQGYPNPFNKTISVSYASGNNTHVRIELLDLVGNSTMVVFEGVRGEGAWEERINTTHLPAGNYIMKVSRNGSAEYRKLIKIQEE